MTPAPDISRARAAWGGSRVPSVALLVLLAVALSSASAGRGPLRQTDKLLIVSTSDVKGKTGPCG